LTQVAINQLNFGCGGTVKVAPSSVHYTWLPGVLNESTWYRPTG